MSGCSIVIPVHGHSTLTRECLDELLAQELGAEIVVVDDASPDNTAAVLEPYGDRVRVVRLDENRGFAGACNAGVEAASGEHVVLLNNDTRPRPGWLAALCGYADAHPAAGIVGCKLLWPTGAVQHAGVVVDADRDVRNVYAGFPGDHPAVNRARRFQIVTAACMLVRRSLWDELGGLDTEFRNGYEDVDFCLRAGERGHEIHYCPDAVVLHLESASRGYEDDEDLANRDIYLRRWAHRIPQDDITVYIEDGLIRLEYAWLSLRVHVDPALGWAATNEDENGVERLLAWRARQTFDLLRENARLALDSDAPAPWAKGG